MKWRGNGSNQHYRYHYSCDVQGYRLWLYQLGDEQRYEWDRELIFEIKDGDEDALYSKLVEAILKRSRKVSVTVDGIPHSTMTMSYYVIAYCGESIAALQNLTDYVKARQRAEELAHQFFLEDLRNGDGAAGAEPVDSVPG